MWGRRPGLAILGLIKAETYFLRSLQGVGTSWPPETLKAFAKKLEGCLEPSRGLQGPPGASREQRARGVCCLKALTRRFARTPQGGPPGRRPKIWACQVEALRLGFRVFPSRGKSMYIVYIWPTGVAGGRAVPPDVREEPGGALYVHSP